jgi:hypothetical protein
VIEVPSSVLLDPPRACLLEIDDENRRSMPKPVLGVLSTETPDWAKDTARIAADAPPAGLTIYGQIQPPNGEEDLAKQRNEFLEALISLHTHLASLEAKQETREKIRADAIRELEKGQLRRGPGRPAHEGDEIKEMLLIIAAHPDKGEKHCRSIFEDRLRVRERGMPRVGKSDGKDWLTRRSKRAWLGAQDALSKAISVV